MIINYARITKLEPCRDRLRNYAEHYGSRKFTARKFMGLKNITHEDKLWVAFRLMDKDKVRLAAADIAELVLHLYEAAYPNDDRPRKAIEAARNGDKDAAAAACAYYAAYYAANAADAAYFAYSAANAACAYYAYYAAFDAANAAANAASIDDKSAMQKKQRTILLRYLK